MQRFVQNYLPPSFENIWTNNRIRRHDQLQIELRNDSSYFIPFARTNQISYQPLIAFPKIWDEFPDESIKIIRNKIEFNTKLKTYLLDKLSPIVNCERLFCPSCNNL
jgi:hypothetical protein